MGRRYDEVWYGRVVKACGLNIDFEQFRNSDLTFVGDRGVQCSGGQRARIGLARAIYADCDVLVADDPFAAVDAKVGRQIYRKALLGLVVNRGKTAIVATHQHHYVSSCHCVLIVDGRVECSGSYKDCIAASNGKLMAHSMDDVEDNDSDEGGALMKKISSRYIVSSNESSDPSDEDDELNVKGLLKIDTYVNYVKAMGGMWVAGVLFVIFSVTQAIVFVYLDLLGNWSELPPDQQRQDWSVVGPMLGLAVLLPFMSALRAHLTFQAMMKASQTLHDRMTKAVLRAKIAFFDTQPLGRIMNRFSADTGTADDLLPLTLFEFLRYGFMVLGTVLFTVIALPFVLVPLPFLCWYFLRVRNVFVSSSRELKRLEGMSRSPIFAMLSESLGGIASIRANDCLDYFKRKFTTVHDAHTRAFFSFIAAARWFGFRMDAIMLLFTAAACYFAVLFNEQGWFGVSASVVGVALSMLLQLTGIFQWTVRQSAETVNCMVSIERILGFTRLEPEAELTKPDDRALVESGWPDEGAISVKDLKVRYRPTLPLVLNNLSFNIPKGSRVGIVGRTGSGKSSLVQALFRLIEADSGCIRIDGVDISTLGLHALRTKISVIPQTPTLFSGCSVRENLDLFGLRSDEELRKVIDECHLSDVVMGTRSGLDAVVTEGGQNFSVGQRQLLCLARALLNKTNILILDEATASIDKKTEKLLQMTVERNFTDGTILAVAHRLETVIESDFILVLGSGQVLEVGKPADLLRSGGHFATMVSDAGKEEGADLRRRSFVKEESDRRFSKRLSSITQLSDRRLPLTDYQSCIYFEC